MSKFIYDTPEPELPESGVQGVMPSPEPPKKRSRKGKAKGKGKGDFLKGLMYPAALLLLVAASLAASWLLQGHSVVQQIEVHAPGFTSAEQVLAQSGLTQGMSADGVRPLEVQERIDALPWVAESRVRLLPGGRVLVDVRERNPLALLVSGSRTMLVDAEGMALRIPAGYMPDLPLLYGFSLPEHGNRLQAPEFEALSEFLQALQQAPVAGMKISEVGWHPEEGVIALSRENAVRLVFGAGDFPEKVDRWEQFYRQLAPVKGMAAFTRLDFRFRNQVVALQS
ncbi:MAG: FtsQ-type POTRA domain-containing protein [Balneolales bacterium]|nr:FtsQ-type POTRA domain-containing protein [Balneolales bacterium]